MVYINPWVDPEILKRVEAQYVDHCGSKLSKKAKKRYFYQYFQIFSIFI